MERLKPWLYATLVKDGEVRHLLILFHEGSALTELLQMSGGEESSFLKGSEYESKAQAEAIAQIWIEDEGFKRLPAGEFAFEPLSHAIALAKRMGFSTVYDARFIKKSWPDPNFTGEVALTSWPGLAAKNGGSYLYGLDQMRLHARPSLPMSAKEIAAPEDANEFVSFMLQMKAILDTVGKPAEFILTGDLW